MGQVEQLIENGMVQVRWGHHDRGPVLTMEDPAALVLAPEYEHKIKDDKDELPQ